MDMGYYDGLYDQENSLIIKQQNEMNRYKPYKCNICERECNMKMNMIKCEFCLTSTNLWKSSNYYLFQPACNHCVQTYNFCIKNKKSKFCKRYGNKLNCSNRNCPNSKGTKNKQIYIIRCKIGENYEDINGYSKWQWRPEFYGYKLDEQYLSSKHHYPSKKSINSNIIPRKIDNDWYRISCDQCMKHGLNRCNHYGGCPNYTNKMDDDYYCTNHSQCIVCNQYPEIANSTFLCRSCLKPCHHRCGNLDDAMCGKCIKQHKAMELLKEIKAGINNEHEYNKYINRHRRVLFKSTRNAIESRFCDNITNIIFDLCIGDDIAYDLLIPITCSHINCCKTNSRTFGVIQGIGSKLYFTLMMLSGTKRSQFHGSYYVLDQEYIQTLNGGNNENNNINLNMFGITEINSVYYRIFCQKYHKLTKCKFKKCKNKESDNNVFCRNHAKCITCNRYIKKCNNRYKVGKCKDCGHAYHDSQCGDRVCKLCNICEKKSKGKTLLNAIKDSINNMDEYEQYILNESRILYAPTKIAIRSKFCDDIANVIFDFCIELDVGRDLIKLVKCCYDSSICCHIECKLYVIRGIKTRLYFDKYRLFKKPKIYYYVLDDEYINKLLLFAKTNDDNKNDDDVLNMYGIHKVQRVYYRIFRNKYNYKEVRKCEQSGCKNKDNSRYCRNHSKCIICNKYVFSKNEYDDSAECDKCNKTYCSDCKRSTKHGMKCDYYCNDNNDSDDWNENNDTEKYNHHKKKVKWKNKKGKTVNIKPNKKTNK